MNTRKGRQERAGPTYPCSKLMRRRHPGGVDHTAPERTRSALPRHPLLSALPAHSFPRACSTETADPESYPPGIAAQPGPGEGTSAAQPTLELEAKPRSAHGRPELRPPPLIG